VYQPDDPINLVYDMFAVGAALVRGLIVMAGKGGELQEMSLEGQVLDQFQRRRMLYANPAYDLTDKLIVRMNNARAAGAPAPATTAPNAK
jgi:hypothetical protein